VKPVTFYSRSFSTNYLCDPGSVLSWNMSDPSAANAINESFGTNNAFILMPEGAMRDELNRTRELTVDIAIRENVRFSEREHIVLWNKKTGV